MSSALSSVLIIKIPPLIPYSYRYLVKITCPLKVKEVDSFKPPVTYLLYEESDFGNFKEKTLPGLLKDLDSSSRVVHKQKFGGVVVEKRIIEHND